VGQWTPVGDPIQRGHGGRLWRVLVGRPLRFGELGNEEITPVEGLSALSLDALTSVAYGPEAIVVVLAGAGAGALRLILPITAAIVALLVILVASYRQVIGAYPGGGGAYAVSRANLGARAGLLAAAALVVDYTLTVAVSIAAGVGALTAAFPALSSATLPLCLGILVVITVMNLRGLGETARAFLLPTLLFVVGVLAIIVVGLVHPLGLHQPQPGHSLVPSRALETVGVLLVLKAFSAGCSALTGVEAIANGVPLFKPPRVQRAKRTELLLGTILGAMLLGLATLDHRWHVGPRSGQTVLSQIMADAVGRHWAFYVVSVTITLVLALAANTSFGGLPVLASLLGRDNYLPHLFSLRGDRQVFTYGIVSLATLAGVLLIAVDGDTQSLIPMFAIGVFTGFTLAQAGMVQHWRTKRPRGWRPRAAVNGLGACVTALATVIFVVTKFTAGGWVVFVAVPCFIVLFVRINHYYQRVNEVLGVGEVPPVPHGRQTFVVVPVTGVSRLTSVALSQALSIGEHVLAVSVLQDEEDADERDAALRAQWTSWNPGVPLRVLRTEYASIAGPIVALIDELRERVEGQIIVLLPVVHPDRRRDALLHNHVDRVVAAALQSREDVVVTRVPMGISTHEQGAVQAGDDGDRVRGGTG
jgi:amino acid transporter